MFESIVKFFDRKKKDRIKFSSKQFPKPNLCQNHKIKKKFEERKNER